jgi:hypothetical protein
VHGLLLVAGTAFLLLSTAALLDAARRLALMAWPDDLLAATLATMTLATAGAIVSMEVLGTVGQLGPLQALALAALTWGGVRRSARGRPPTATNGAVLRVRLPRTPLALAASVLVVLLVAALVYAVLSPRPLFDAMSGHLPVMVQWLQHGSTAIMPYTSPVSAEPHYPANSQALALWLTLGERRDFLTQLACLPGLLMLVFGVALLGRELGARTQAAAAAALLVPTIPLFLGQLVGTNMTDLTAGGAVAAMSAFTALAGRRQGRAAVALAGLSAGLALGTRYAAIFAIVPVGVLLLVFVVRGRERVALGVGILVLTAAAGGGYWYVRNALLTGDPVYPQPLLGLHPAVAAEMAAFPAFRSYLQVGWVPDQWPLFLQQGMALGGPVYLLLFLGALVTPLHALARSSGARKQWLWALVPPVELLAFIALPLSAGFLVNGRLNRVGISLNLRYALPALIITAAVLSAMSARLPARVEAAALALLMALGAVFAVTNTEHPIPLIAFPLAVAVIALGWGIVAMREPRARLAVVGVAALAFCVAAPWIASYHDSRRDAAGVPMEAAQRHLRPTDRSIAVAGFCEIYGLYGPALDRRVEYLTGADDGISRPVATTYERWLSSLQTRGVTAVVVGVDACFRDLDVPQKRWIGDHPEVFHLLFSSGEEKVYSVG